MFSATSGELGTSSALPSMVVAIDPSYPDVTAACGVGWIYSSDFIVEVIQRRMLWFGSVDSSEELGNKKPPRRPVEAVPRYMRVLPE